MTLEENLIQEEILKAVSYDVLLPQSTYELFRKQLADYINALINNNFQQLIYLLYRLDINEKKLKGLLAGQPGSDAGFLIADMMIERQLQKIQSRQQYRQPNRPIPDDERW